ncbi:MAG: hypothetical protein ABSH34_35280 [Verrucomicrobiota bacterium]|jgi:hypothetical protein
MKWAAFQVLHVAVFIVAGLFFASRAEAQTPGPGSGWVYALTEGSQLTEDCPICDRVTVPVPMRGTFELRFSSQGPLFTDYAVGNIAFTAGRSNGPAYKVTGQGVYVLGGEIAVIQSLSLAVQIDNGTTNELCYLTNAMAPAGRPWPLLQAGVDQTNGTFIQQYRLDLNAAPFRELWFSTAAPFLAGGWNPPTNAISAGDLLSMSGRVVRRNQQLTGQLGIMPPVPDLGLKGLDVLPGGEIVFSITQDVFSEPLGALHPGDLLSDEGRIVRANLQLIGAFSPSPAPPSGFGLGAVQVMDSGEIYFSVQTNFYSTNLGLKVQTGDLLSETGTIIRSGAQLLAAFNPTNTTTDRGLTAFHVWPSGEIWFATAQGFYDALSNFYAPGDLLSDYGYVVYRNSDFVSAFGGSGGVAGVGLDALFVVSDVTAVNGAARLRVPQPASQPPASLALRWQGEGRVFQLERAAGLTGAFLPASPIDTANSFIDPGILNQQGETFYRVRQW